MRFVSGGKVYDDGDQATLYEAPYHGARGFDKAGLYRAQRGTLFMCVGMIDQPAIRRFYSALPDDINAFLEESKAPASVYTACEIELEEA